MSAMIRALKTLGSISEGFHPIHLLDKLLLIGAVNLKIMSDALKEKKKGAAI